MLPNFLIIGAAKSGTTSLYNYLKEHPDIYMSEIKEINFFSSQYIPTQHKKKMTIDEYQEYFHKVSNQKMIGECSPTYLWIKESAGEIKKVLDNPKIIIMLRNPIERYISDFRYSQAHGHNLITMNKCIKIGLKEKVNHWFSPNSLIDKGLYFSQVKHYLDVFDKENIKILLFENLKENTPKVIKDLYFFLGVDDNFIPEFNTIYNKGIQIDEEQENNIKTTNILNYLKTNFLPENYQLRKSVDLLYDIYQIDIKKLQEIIEPDIMHWLKKPGPKVASANL